MTSLLPSNDRSQKRPHESPARAADDFGIVIACCDQDYLFAKGCCASIRHFLGDVPICLIIDGAFSVAPLERTYGVRVLYRKDVADPVLRERSFGWGYTKLVAYWESPWERFLYVDSDAVIWGDVLAKVRGFHGCDALIARFTGKHDEKSLHTYFFDTRRMDALFPEFDWRRHRDAFFCAGVVTGRRGLLDRERYLHLMDLQQQNPGLFMCGDQGITNMLLFEAADRGAISLSVEDFQYVAADCSAQELERRFPVSSEGPVVGAEATVLHWGGPKPLLRNPGVYSAPMTFFRRKFLRDAYGYTGRWADLCLVAEDLMHHALVFKNRLRRLVKNRILPRLARRAKAASL